MRNSVRQRKYGFSLGQSLVVMTIIPVLATLLLPTLAEMRFRAKCLVCASNLRQWGIACNLYAQDYRGALPRFDVCANQAGCIWDMPGGFYPNGLMNYGIVSNSMYFCPLDTRHETTKKLFNHPAYGNCLTSMSMQVWGTCGTNGVPKDWGYFNSYVWWVTRHVPPIFAPQFPDGLYPHVDPYNIGIAACTNHVTSVRDPSDFPIMSDYVQAISQGNYPMNPITYMSSLSGGHWLGTNLDNCNVLYVNGRVETHKLSQIKGRTRNAAWQSFDFFY